MRKTHLNRNRTVVGHPVDLASGVVYTAAHDFDLSGVIPIVWRRFYSTSHLELTPLGRGWMTPFFMSLTRQDDDLVLRDEEGQEIRFRIKPGSDSAVNYGAQMELRRQGPFNVIYYWHHQERYLFELSSRENRWRLARIEDLYGNALIIHYDEQGRFSAVEQPGKRLVQADYNDSGLISILSLVVPGASQTPLVSYEYDQQDRLAGAFDPEGAPLRYEYDANHYLAKETNRLGGSFYFEYDWEGYCIHTWGDGQYLERVIDFNKETLGVTVTDSLGSKTAYQFNEEGLESSSTNPLGAQRKKAYDGHGRKLAEIDPLGLANHFEYDATGDLVAFTDPQGNQTRYSYNALHQIVRLVDAGGNIWSREYDSRGFFASETNPLGDSWKYLPDERGLLKIQVNPEGYRSGFTYDELGNLTSVSDPLGGSTRFDWDARGKLLRTIDPLHNETRFTYDKRGLLISTTTADGCRLVTRYDAETNPTEEADGLNRVSRFEYDRFGNLIAEYDPLGNRISYSYDTEARLVSITNEKGERQEFEYDAAGRLIKEVGFDQRTHIYTYDLADRLTALNDAGDEVRFAYNAAGDVVERAFPDGTKVTYSYDRLGRLTDVINPTTAVKYEYDAAGRVVRTTQGSAVLEYKYNSLGQRTHLESSLGHERSYTYDENSRLASIRIGQRRQHFTWDEVDRLIAIERPSGFITRFVHRPGGLLTNQRTTNNKGELLLDQSYSWNRGDELVELSDNRIGRTTYSYDAKSQLRARHSSNEIEEFSYDVGGDVTSRNGVRFEYGPGNRLRSMGGIKFQTDARGNVAEWRGDGEWAVCSYNTDNELVSMLRSDGNHVEFRYDGLGRRVGKVANGRPTEYVWDGADLLSERGDARELEYDFFPDTFMPLSIKVSAASSSGPGTWYDVVFEHNGAARALVGGDGGLAWEARYSAFGETKGNYSVENPIRFLGQYYDRETG
ncbi:MAG TPA: DUF6531 domain-containing protein, partial [Blastocatellia bacterium]|nr:DUF6531 domain-containing protein [Blastocatellia bacterium]